MTDKLFPIHPGEVLLEEFIKPMNLSQNHLAINIGVDARHINEIVLGKRSITADTALRLARFFGNSPSFGWDCKHSTILTLPKTPSVPGWIVKYARWQLQIEARS
jgi:addiction module HigA family antidote